MVDRKVVASGLYDALEDADRRYRARERRGHVRKTFKRVDRIKQRPGWLPWWKRRTKEGER